MSPFPIPISARLLHPGGIRLGLLRLQRQVTITTSRTTSSSSRLQHQSPNSSSLTHHSHPPTTVKMATNTKPKITLYVDIVSPFAYMAYYILRHDPVFATCDVTYIPIFLGGLMHKCGNTAPMNIKNKDKYISLERLRWSAAFSIPIATEMPPDFPALTLPTMRALAVLYEECGDGGEQTKLVAALDALYAATWVERKATHKGDVLMEVLEGVLGEGEAGRVLQASTTTGKALLLKLTESAFDAGAFGLPWMVCTDPKTGKSEGFWGVDHLGQVAQFLGLPVPKTAGDKAGWKALL